MADKQRVKKDIKNLQRIKTWQLVILLLLAMLVSATFLRLNNVGMLERRTAVHSADEHGDTEAIKNNLFALQRYAASHMNATTGIVALEGEYNRALQKAVQSAQASDTSGEDVYAKADTICKQQYSGYSQGYVLCYAAELDKYPAAQQPDQVALPQADLYKHEFISPLWTPDYAGWSVVICLLITLVITVRLLSLTILKLLLRRHYDTV